MAFGELYSALQAGVMDGQENPLAQIASGRLHEVQKYLSLSGHVYTPAYLIIGEDTWKKLPADVQKGLTRIASQMGEFARSEGARLDKELIGQMKALQINEVDKEAFIKASEKVYQQFATEVPGGAQLVKTIQGLR
jgi:TRAP-type C4-dicarboxylate transport system substrate-binding protein